jgi:hypothetical protein
MVIDSGGSIPSGGDSINGNRPATGGGTSSPISLCKGSKGDAVRRLQIALLKIDSKALPRFGADGSFGSETEAAAMRLMGKNCGITEQDINMLSSGATATTPPSGRPAPMPLPQIHNQSQDRIRAATALRNSCNMYPNRALVAQKPTQVAAYKTATNSDKSNYSRTVVVQAGSKIQSCINISKFNIDKDGFIELHLRNSFSPSTGEFLIRFSPYNITV